MIVKVDLQVSDFSEEELRDFLSELHEEFDFCEHLLTNGVILNDDDKKHAQGVVSVVKDFAVEFLGVRSMQQVSTLNYFLENIDSLSEEKLKTLL